MADAWQDGSKSGVSEIAAERAGDVGGNVPELAQLEALLRKDPFSDMDRSAPIVPPLQLGGGLMRLNPDLRAAWDDALAKHQAKGVSSQHRTAIPGKEVTARPKSARPTTARSAAAAARSGAVTERLTRPTQSAKIKHQHRLKQVEQIRAQAASHLASSFQLYSHSNAGGSVRGSQSSAKKRPVYAPTHTPTVDGIFRAAAANESAKESSRSAPAPKGRGSKPWQEDRPWRRVPEGFVEKGKPKSNPVPKYVDPDVTMDRWKKRWELKILNDPDLKVMRVSLGDNLSSGRRADNRGHSPSSRTPSPDRRNGALSPDGALTPNGADASIQALTAVHLIRENQRARIKQYNQSLISTPTPRTPLVDDARRRARSSGPQTDHSAHLSPPRATSQDPASARKHPRHDTASFDAATRHIARQRAALAARAQRMGGGTMKRAKSAEPLRVPESSRRDKTDGQAYTPELSKTMRAAGTASNAKRGVRHMVGTTPRARGPGSSPEGAGAVSLGEKFHMLEAHLRKSALSDTTLDHSGDFGEAEGDRSVDSARVEYLFKADAPVSGLPHTSASSSASVIVRTEQAARPPPFSSQSPREGDLSMDVLAPRYDGRRTSGNDASRRGSAAPPRQQVHLPHDDDDAPCSSHVLLLQEEDKSALSMSADTEPWPLIEAAGVVGLKKGPVEPLLAAHMAAGLEHTLRKDPSFVDGPYRPQLIGLEVVGTTPLPREPLPLLVMPCGALIWRTQGASQWFSAVLPQGNGAGIYLHCYLRYREEPSEGVWLPEALFIATRWPYHSTLAHALRLFVEGLPAGDAVREPWGKSHALALATHFAVDPPLPARPLYLQIREQAVHVQRPAARDLPLADIDYAVLFRCLDVTSIKRLLVLLLLGEPRMLVIADDTEILFPVIQALVSLLYPFSWKHTLMPNLPATYLMELDAPFPFILGITRPALPRGRVPSNVCQVDATHKTLSLPPQQTAIENSEGGRQLVDILDSAFQDFTDDVRKATDDSAGGDWSFEAVFEKGSGVQAPGAWGSSSSGASGGGAQLHGCIETLRNSMCSKLAAVLFRYPLFVRAGAGESDNHNQGGTRGQHGNSTVKLDMGGFMCASEFPALLQDLSKTQMLSQLVLARVHVYADVLGLKITDGYADKAGRGEEANDFFDIFDTHVQRRLEGEAQLITDIERAGHICGFLFVQEPAGSGSGGGGGDARWNLKWCELSGMDLKMYVFDSPGGGAARDGSTQESSHGTLTLRHSATMVRTMPPARRDPTAVCRVGTGRRE